MLPWETFLARYRPMAQALARRLSANPSDAEDIVQEALVALHRAQAETPDRFASSAHARNYFLKAVRNLAHKSRERRRIEPLQIDPPAPSLEAGRADRDRKAALRRAMEQLTGEERELIVARFLQRRTLAELSNSMHVAISTLHSRERALLRKLQEKLSNPRRNRP